MSQRKKVEKISEVRRDISTVWHASFKEGVSYPEAIHICKNDFCKLRKAAHDAEIGYSCRSK